MQHFHMVTAKFLSNLFAVHLAMFHPNGRFSAAGLVLSRLCGPGAETLTRAP
jgi:hypothetical protein